MSSDPALDKQNWENATTKILLDTLLKHGAPNQATRALVNHRPFANGRALNKYHFEHKAYTWVAQDNLPATFYIYATATPTKKIITNKFMNDILNTLSIPAYANTINPQCIVAISLFTAITPNRRKELEQQVPCPLINMEGKNPQILEMTRVWPLPHPYEINPGLDSKGKRHKRVQQYFPLDTAQHNDLWQYCQHEFKIALQTHTKTTLKRPRQLTHPSAITYAEMSTNANAMITTSDVATKRTRDEANEGAGPGAQKPRIEPTKPKDSQKQTDMAKQAIIKRTETAREALAQLAEDKKTEANKEAALKTEQDGRDAARIEQAALEQEEKKAHDEETKKRKEDDERLEEERNTAIKKDAERQELIQTKAKADAKAKVAQEAAKQKSDLDAANLAAAAAINALDKGTGAPLNPRARHLLTTLPPSPMMIATGTTYGPTDVKMSDPGSTAKLFASYPTTMNAPQPRKPPTEGPLIYLCADKSKTEDQRPETSFGLEIAQHPCCKGLRILPSIEDDRSQNQPVRVACAFVDSEEGQALRHRALTSPNNITENGHLKFIPNFTNYKDTITFENMDSALWSHHVMAKNQLLPTTWTERPANAGKGRKGGGRSTNNQDALTIQNPTKIVQNHAWDWAKKAAIPFFPIICKTRSRQGNGLRFEIIFLFNLDPVEERELLRSCLADLETLTLGSNENCLYVDLMRNPSSRMSAWRLCDCRLSKDCIENNECLDLPSNWKTLHHFLLLPDYSGVHNRQNYPKELQIPFLYLEHVQLLQQAYDQIYQYWQSENLEGIEDMIFIIKPRSFPLANEAHTNPIPSASIYVSHPEILNMPPILEIINNINTNTAGYGEIIIASSEGGHCWRCGGGHPAHDCNITPGNDPYRQMHHRLSTRSICHSDPCKDPNCNRAHYGMDHYPDQGFFSHVWKNNSDPTDAPEEDVDPSPLPQDTRATPPWGAPPTPPPLIITQFFEKGTLNKSDTLNKLPRSIQSMAKPIYCSALAKLPPNALPSLHATEAEGQYPCPGWLTSLLGLEVAAPQALTLAFGPTDLQGIKFIADHILYNTDLARVGNRIPLGARKALSGALGFTQTMATSAPLHARQSMTQESFPTLALALLQDGTTLVTISIADNSFKFEAYGPTTDLIRVALRLSFDTDDTDFLLIPLIDTSVNPESQDLWAPHYAPPSWWDALQMTVNHAKQKTHIPQSNIHPQNRRQPNTPTNCKPLRYKHQNHNMTMTHNQHYNPRPPSDPGSYRDLAGTPNPDRHPQNQVRGQAGPIHPSTLNTAPPYPAKGRHLANPTPPRGGSAPPPCKWSNKTQRLDPPPKQTPPPPRPPLDRAANNQTPTRTSPKPPKNSETHTPRQKQARQPQPKP
jgi:hypothetical protein